MSVFSMRRTAVVALLSSLPTGCYLGVDWEGLAGSYPPSDPGPDVADATSQEAADDASHIGDGSDGGDADDAGDAGDASDANACPAGGFCDDFERTTVLGNWDTQVLVPGNTLTITNNAYAGSGALRTTLSTDEGARAILRKEFPSSTDLRLRYQVFVGALVARGNGTTPVSLKYANRTEVLIVELQGGNVFLAEQQLNTNGSQDSFTPHGLAAVRPNEWVEVILQVSLGTTIAHAKLSYGGAVVFDANLDKEYGANAFRVEVGTSYAGTGAIESFDIDDVQVTWTPTQ